MKKAIIPILLLALSGCYTQYPTTTFWVHNNTEKAVNLTAIVFKDSLPPPHLMNLSYTILPADSVLFLQSTFNKQGNPAKVFKEMKFVPVDKQMNRPTDSLNWIKTTDSKGKPKFNFYIYPTE
jgi:hypothetical protein